MFRTKKSSKTPESVDEKKPDTEPRTSPTDGKDIDELVGDNDKRPSRLSKLKQKIKRLSSSGEKQVDEELESPGALEPERTESKRGIKLFGRRQSSAVKSDAEPSSIITINEEVVMLRTKVQSQEHELNTLKAQALLLEESSNGYQEQLQKYLQEKLAQKHEIDELHRAIVKAQQEKQRVEQELKEKEASGPRSSVGQAAKMLQEANDKIQKLESMLNTSQPKEDIQLREQRDALEKEVLLQQQTIKTQQELIHKHESRLETQEQDLSVLKAKLLERDEQQHLNKNQMLQQQSKLEAQIERQQEQLERKEQRAIELETLVKQLQQENLNSQTDLAKMRQEAQELKNLQQEQANGKLASAQEQQRKIGDLKHEIEAIENQLQQHLTESKGEMQELAQRNKEQERENLDLKKKLYAAQEKTIEANELLTLAKSQNHDLTQDLRQQLETNTGLKRDLDQAIKAREEAYSILESQKARYRALKRKLKDLREANNLHIQSEKQVASLEAEKEALNQQLDQIKTQAKSADEKSQQLETEMVQLQSKKEQLSKQVETLKNQLQETEKIFEEQLSSAVSQSNMNLSQQDKQALDLRLHLAQVNSQSEQLKQEVAEKSQLLAVSRLEKYETEHNLQQAKQQVQILTDKLSQLQQEHHLVNQQLVKQEELVKGLKENLRETQHALDRLKSTARDQASHIQALEQNQSKRDASAGTELQSLNQQLDEITEALRKLYSVVFEEQQQQWPAKDLIKSLHVRLLSLVDEWKQIKKYSQDKELLKQHEQTISILRQQKRDLEQQLVLKAVSQPAATVRDQMILPVVLEQTYSLESVTADLIGMMDRIESTVTIRKQVYHHLRIGTLLSMGSMFILCLPLTLFIVLDMPPNTFWTISSQIYALLHALLHLARPRE